MLQIIFLQNQSREERTVKITMLCNSTFYTGKKAHQIKQGDGEFILQPYESKRVLLINILRCLKVKVVCSTKYAQLSFRILIPIR